jgi:hypothetical protein
MTPGNPAGSPLTEQWERARRKRAQAREWASLVGLVAACTLALGLAALLAIWSR